MGHLAPPGGSKERKSVTRYSAKTVLLYTHENFLSVANRNKQCCAAQTDKRRRDGARFDYIFTYVYSLNIKRASVKKIIVRRGKLSVLYFRNL